MIGYICHLSPDFLDKVLMTSITEINNPYSATLFLDVALLSAALFMNVCSHNASLFCNANVLRLLTAFCSLDLNKTFSKSVICIHYLSNKNKNSFQTILNLYLKSEYVTLFYWCLGRIDIGLHQIWAACYLHNFLPFLSRTNAYIYFLGVNLSWYM